MQEFLAETHPSVYKQCSYVSLEASPTLAELQREQLSEHQGFSAIVGDARDAASWGPIQSVRSLLQLNTLEHLKVDAAQHGTRDHVCC